MSGSVGFRGVGAAITIVDAIHHSLGNSVVKLVCSDTVNALLVAKYDASNEYLNRTNPLQIWGKLIPRDKKFPFSLYPEEGLTNRDSGMDTRRQHSSDHKYLLQDNTSVCGNS